VVGDHEIGGCEPLGTGRLGLHPRSCVFLAHPTLGGTGKSYVVTAVDHDPLPVVPKTMAQQRDLHHHCPVDIFDAALDHLEDVGVSDPLECGQLTWLVEDNRSQGRPVDLTVTDHMGPAFGHLGESRSIGVDHEVADAVGIDGHDPGVGQVLAHLALARGETAAQYPSVLLRTHEARR